MSTVGIIAEYNPFHNGHKYHIGQAKRASGADKAVVVMSGSFVQRGEPACADKFVRAGWAIDNGADMVIELPEVFSLSCAERFASGGVRLLSGTGIVSGICFGSETGDAESIARLARQTPDTEILGTALKKGCSYPAALSAAITSEPGPNDILASEYVRAIDRCCPEMKFYPVKREGDGYSSDDLGGEFSSANSIRKALSRYDSVSRMSPAVFDGLSSALPRGVLEEISALMKKGFFPSTIEGLSDTIMYALRVLGADGVSLLPEAAEGLENLFAKHSMDSTDITETLSKVKSKRYTMARLKRIAMCAILGISAAIQAESAENDSALYARVLAVSKGSESLLSELKEKSRIPVIVRSSDRNGLPRLAAEVERIAAKAHAIQALGRPYEKHVQPDESYRLIVR